MGWSRVGWSGVKWGGVEWGGVGWGGVGWSMLYTQALLGMRPGIQFRLHQPDVHVDYINQTMPIVTSKLNFHLCNN